MRKWMTVLTVFGLASLYGCGNEGVREEKREADRTAIQLADTQRDRDADKAEVDQLKTQLQDLQTKDSATTDQNAKLTQEVQQLQDQLNAKSATTGPAK